MTVSGLTVISADRPPDHNRDSTEITVDTIEYEPPGLLTSLQHGQLMTQCDDLRLYHSLAAESGEKGFAQHYYKVEHGGRRLTAKALQLQQFQSRASFSVGTIVETDFETGCPKC
jgi:hypothetical protein